MLGSVPDVGFDMYCKVECGKVDYKLKLKFNFCSRDALLNVGLREDFMSSFMISAFEMVYSSKVLNMIFYCLKVLELGFTIIALCMGLCHRKTIHVLRYNT